MTNVRQSQSLSAVCTKILALLLFLFILAHQLVPFKSKNGMSFQVERKPHTSTLRTDLPLPLSKLMEGIPKRPSASLPQTPPFTRPRSLTVIATQLPDTEAILLRVFTSGVETGVFGRNFNVRGCLVGTDAYSATSAQRAAVICNVPRPIKIGERITALLEVDDVLLRAMEGPETIKGTVFEVEKGDITIVGKKTFNRDAPLDNVNLAFIRSDVKWSPGLLEPHVDLNGKNETSKQTMPRYDLCLMTAMKEETYLLRDWAMYHHMLGVDKIFIYDNEAPVDIAALLEDLPYVEVVFWPFARSQVQSDNHFMYASQVRCEFAAYFDADEYAFPGEMTPGALKRYVHKRYAEGYNHIMLGWIYMVNNEYVERPEGHLPELYTRRATDWGEANGKVVVSCDVAWRYHGIHQLMPMGPRIPVTRYWNKTDYLYPSTIEDPAMLVHYTKRSWEEYVHKVEQGRGGILGIGPQDETLKVNEPRPKYMATKGTFEYTFFKGKYSKLMSMKDNTNLEVVRWRDGRRCVSLDLGPEVCEK